MPGLSYQFKWNSKVLLRQIYRKFVFLWMLSEQRWVIYDDEICDCLLFRKVILYSREENKCMSSVTIVIITCQQAYLHIACGFMTQGNSTFMTLLLFRGEENCSPSTTRALRCSVSGCKVLLLLSSWHLGKCGPPPDIPGALLVSETNKTEFESNESLKYSCRPGYIRATSGTAIYCEAKGTWTVTISCVSKYRHLFFSLMHLPVLEHWLGL